MLREELCRKQCSVEEGDWLAVVSDDLWWPAKAMDADRQHHHVRLEFMHESV